MAGAAARPAAALLAVLLAACAGSRAPRPYDAALREFSAGGYASREHDLVTTTRQRWQVSAQEVGIVVSRPERRGASPLVVYLPGVGESSEAGARWRMAWASAGYVVMSVQLLEDDARAWTSDLAREGEFKMLGRRHFAGEAMNRRLQMLSEMLGEARRRADAGDAAWQLVDWGRVGIAGFDLGAYTAMAVAGDRVRGADAAVARVAIRAAIVLSPYASAADGAPAARYEDVLAPVLSVTSDADTDLLGLVDDASLRRLAFDRMPGPDKFLLSLQGLPHTGLSGSPGAESPRAGTAEAKSSHDRAANTGGEDSGPRHRGGKRSNAGEAGRGDRVRAGVGDSGAGAGLSAAALQQRLSAVEGVSTAFVDAYVKDDRRAREWLADAAARWLGVAGELRHKRAGPDPGPEHATLVPTGPPAPSPRE